jgi:iron-sulfur cluster assembly accessory protein
VLPVVEVFTLRPYLFIGLEPSAGIAFMAQSHPTDEATPVTLTERAAKRVNAILAKESDGSALRISVNGGGCSGFSYAFDIGKDRSADDIVVARDGATVLIDAVSVEYMKGATIDFVDDLMGQAFRIENPMATSGCGCGTSFSL